MIYAPTVIGIHCHRHLPRPNQAIIAQRSVTLPTYHSVGQCHILWMTTPRSKLVDCEVALHYHLISRCVRRSWLCGYDKPRRKQYDHRKKWLEERILTLANFFSVEIDAYAIMSNHFHLVVYYDPNASHKWDDVEVARRWQEVFPPRLAPKHVKDMAAIKALRRDNMLKDPNRIKKARYTLGSLSMFMKHLKQPIAWRANREDKCTGHFFESRFYSGALLSEDAVIATMAYVDLNPVRAKICEDIEAYEHTSIYRRIQELENTPELLDQFMAPLNTETDDKQRRVPIRLADYLSLLKLLCSPQTTHSTDEEAIWFSRVASLKKRQRAYGNSSLLKSWTKKHGWKQTGDVFV